MKMREGRRVRGTTVREGRRVREESGEIIVGKRERQEERGHERGRRKAVKSPHFLPSPVVCNHDKGLGTGSHHLLLSLATSGVGEGGRRE